MRREGRRFPGERLENEPFLYTRLILPLTESHSCDKSAALSASATGSFHRLSLQHPFRNSETIHLGLFLVNVFPGAPNEKE
jgi:hypothetical protein